MPSNPLVSLGDWVESNTVIVALRIAVTLEKEIELLDGRSGLVAFAFVIPEV